MPGCRACQAGLEHKFVSLGLSPLSNSYLTADEAKRPSKFYPLEVYVCARCLLVQAVDSATPEEIFSEYAYFSSYSQSWLMHAKKFADMAFERFSLNDKSLVMEVASNDGYLLQYFIEKGVPVLGIEPACNVAKEAIKKGVPTRTVFFGLDIARSLVAEGLGTDLLVANNVLAHVPRINDFCAGVREVLKPHGVAVFEFPHVVRLVEGVQFDTIYHEHMSYLSLHVVENVLKAHGLYVFDVEELPTHGGSLRVYAARSEACRKAEQSVALIREEEVKKGYCSLDVYLGFEDKVRRLKREILKFFIKAKDEGKTIVGYGAPAKGNTLLNYCGIRTDFMDYTVDRNPYKQGKFLPGTLIPIEAPDKIKTTRPDYVFILPWNIKDEIMADCSFIRGWGAKFVVPVPKVEVL